LNHLSDTALEKFIRDLNDYSSERRSTLNELLVRLPSSLENNGAISHLDLGDVSDLNACLQASDFAISMYTIAQDKLQPGDQLSELWSSLMTKHLLGHIGRSGTLISPYLSELHRILGRYYRHTGQ